MSALRVFQVAAFADRPYRGNPAAVVLLLEESVSATAMQQIAAELGQPAAAFLRRHEGRWFVRWFTPTQELPLCGHGTLAAAYVLYRYVDPAQSAISLATGSAGVLTVRREGRFISLDLPADPPQVTPDASTAAGLFGFECEAILATDSNYFVVMSSASAVRRYAPDLTAIARLPKSGVILTARGDQGFDCVSRYFAPKKGVGEDAVTGSAHCSLIPYWSAALGKADIHAWQASARGGELHGVNAGARVRIAGECAPFLEGTVLDGEPWVDGAASARASIE